MPSLRSPNMNKREVAAPLDIPAGRHYSFTYVRPPIQLTRVNFVGAGGYSCLKNMAMVSGLPE